MDAQDKPILVAAAFNSPGHTTGLLTIAEHLVKRGFRLYFIAGPGYQAAIEQIGAEFVKNEWAWEPLVATAPPDADEPWFFKHVFGDSVPVAHRILKETLERVRREHPDREVVILNESMSGGLGPFCYGAPLPEGYASLPKAITFHTSIYVATDYNVPPFGPALDYDPTPENLALWRSTYDAMRPIWTGVSEYYSDRLFKPLGATRPVTEPFFDFILGLGDVTVLATSPSLEYPIHNKPSRLRFIGGLPAKPPDPAFIYPAWWPTITTNAALPEGSPDRRKLVFVTQGTAHCNYADLLIPTIRALAGRADLLVVATLGRHGTALDSGVALPANAIVVDYLPYNAILPYTDVFVSNAGYGGFMHGVMNGGPMVLAGTAADKGEVSCRGEYAGMAVNLRAQAPGEDAIAAAVDKVLKEEKFKARAMEFKRENEELDALGSFERIIEELVGKQ
ncbi:f10e3bff-0624-4837-b9dc-47cf4d37bd1b [Thermothielavioides terrestris]|uniref:Glycosyltransferase family 1 protein n=2 Tax=Thermothielavioides terrestris TaxID=2587410 RepID=G2RGU3_THETT|nr:glycosyltransferase family 1 protein [Thermothielavioides terrestris NRRL 8126]AEO71928.1 glycosyltransferase family 1 protein [Thermothielavioides terrestris NRRL 8126]SPQ27090.1 f10e3bff-0624-4837-b9dc-47cf4d37bd1b [Thermothielavioides terrestris]